MFISLPTHISSHSLTYSTRVEKQNETRVLQSRIHLTITPDPPSVGGSGIGQCRVSRSEGLFASTDS